MNVSLSQAPTYLSHTATSLNNLTDLALSLSEDSAHSVSTALLGLTASLNEKKVALADLNLDSGGVIQA